MGRLWALTFTPVIVMTFEFCQRGVTVDAPFLTVLVTWTSTFEHSVLIHARVCFEFSEVSATRLALRSLDLLVLCLVLHQTLVVLLLRAGNGLLAIPTPHRPWLEATDPVLLLPAIGDGWSALFMVCTLYGRPTIVLVNFVIFGWPTTVHLLLADILCQL